MREDLELQIRKLRETTDLLKGCFELLLNDISGPEWLSRLGNLANCNNVVCIWWPAGQPDAYVQEAFGPEMDLSANFVRELDHLLGSINPKEPGLIDELAKNAGVRIDYASHPLFKPDQLIGCVDWEPAYVLFILNARMISPDWQDIDRERLARVLPIIHKSVAVKKKLSLNEDFIELSSKVHHESSRGFLTITPGRKVVGANRTARDFLAQSALLRIRSNRLEFSDEQLQLEFKEKLAEIENASKSELGNFNWYRNIGKLAEACYVLLTARAFHMENWRRESSPHKTMIVITLEKMQPQAAPEEAQLQEFYNLTKAQARLVRQLASSIDVEEAANALNISVNTARSHLRAIYTRMGVSNKAQLLQQIGSTISGRTRDSD